VSAAGDFNVSDVLVCVYWRPLTNDNERIDEYDSGYGAVLEWWENVSNVL